jgi:hypothetical protein
VLSELNVHSVVAEDLLFFSNLTRLDMSDNEVRREPCACDGAALMSQCDARPRSSRSRVCRRWWSSTFSATRCNLSLSPLEASSASRYCPSTEFAGSTNSMTERELARLPGA